MIPSRRERLVRTLAAVLLVAAFSGIPAVGQTSDDALIALYEATTYQVFEFTGEGFRQVFSHVAFGC